jgi:hypothetical protein
MCVYEWPVLAPPYSVSPLMLLTTITALFFQVSEQEGSCEALDTRGRRRTGTA